MLLQQPVEPRAAGRTGILRRVARGVLAAAAVASPFATHLLVATGVGLPVALALAVAQWCLALGALVRSWSGRRFGRAALGVLAAVAALGGMVAYQAAARIPAEAGLLVVSGVSHLAINSLLLALFAGTLLPGRTPLVVAMGRRLDPHFNPALARYARGVTWAWCGFFAGQIAGSALLLALAPVPVWSLFVNVLDLPLVAAMFVAEDLVRRMRFPDHPHVSLPDLVRAVRRGEGWRGAFASARA